MSGAPRSPTSASGSAPLLAPAQAAILLDQVIYEQVVECIDLDALYRLEQSLIMIVAPDLRRKYVGGLLDRGMISSPTMWMTCSIGRRRTYEAPVIRAR